jgi:hypothetical protein
MTLFFGLFCVIIFEKHRTVVYLRAEVIWVPWVTVTHRNDPLTEKFGKCPRGTDRNLDEFCDPAL